LTRRVIFGLRATADLAELYDYIADQASPTTALRYVDRLERHCRGFDLFGERGTRSDDIRPGMRTAHFERSLMIVFTVDAEEVTILRLLYGGRNVETALDP
jgi:toxin ParE1/3/4